MSSKVLAFVFVGLFLPRVSSAEQAPAPIIRTAPESTRAVIPGPLADGRPSAPPPPVEKPDFQVRSTQVRELEVSEAPPMPGLPPVTGTIRMTVHEVDDPGLPDPPPPPPPQPLDPEAKSRLAALSANFRRTKILFLSATVYDHSRTLLRCYPNGSTGRTIFAWSNLDFNHFSGFGDFEASGADGSVRKYSLHMGIGNENTATRREFMAARGYLYKEPDIPAIPDGPPAFVILTDDPDAEGVVLLEDLHALYRGEGPRMAAACAAREQASAARKAYLLANPPKPKDVTIHFWKRENPAAPAAQQEGGRP
jgi:hypothetical protein